jgi:hypothetical protein
MTFLIQFDEFDQGLVKIYFKCRIRLVQHVMEVFFLLICLRIKLQIHEKRYDFHY